MQSGLAGLRQPEAMPTCMRRGLSLVEITSWASSMAKIAMTSVMMVMRLESFAISVALSCCVVAFMTATP